MSSLRRPVRLTVEHGAQMYATVEHVVYGHATVRLASNGARLTTLPVLGASVSVGDRVVVDYSAEGKPYVRPITIPTEETAILATETHNEPEESDPETIEIARITMSQDQVEETGWTCGVGCTSHSHIVNFDTVVFDPAGMFMVDAVGPCLAPPSPGKYLLRWTVGVSAPAPPFNKGAYIKVAAYRREGPYATSFFLGAPRWRRWFLDGDAYWNVVTSSVILNLTPDNLDRVHIKVTPFWGGWSATKGDDNSPYTILAEEGRWPMLDMYKICGLGPDSTAGALWYENW